MADDTSWRTIARRVILKALEDAKAQGLDPKATLALVDSRYPFGVRDYHPYKMWLSERRKLVTHPTPQALQEQARDRHGRPEFGGAIVDTNEYTWGKDEGHGQTKG